MKLLLKNRKSAFKFLVVALAVGLFFIGKFIYCSLTENAAEDVEEQVQVTATEDSTPKTGFDTAFELDEFLDRTAWEGTGKDGTKAGIMFMGDTGADYKMVSVATMHGGSPSAYRVSYSVIDGKTILYDANKSSSSVELECLVSADRKSLKFDGITYHKVDMLDWIE